MDYQELLRKYIEHVKQSEGYDFLDHLNQNYASDVKFSDEEVDALNRAARASSQSMTGD